MEEQALVVDSLLYNLNGPEPEMDKKWAKEAKRRLAELRSGRVEATPGEEVFARAWRKLEK
mgnify:CR=1 FL=1